MDDTKYSTRENIRGINYVAGLVRTTTHKLLHPLSTAGFKSDYFIIQPERQQVGDVFIGSITGYRHSRAIGLADDDGGYFTFENIEQPFLEVTGDQKRGRITIGNVEICFEAGENDKISHGQLTPEDARAIRNRTSTLNEIIGAPKPTAYVTQPTMIGSEGQKKRKWLGRR